jgi:hypothetical protein
MRNLDSVSTKTILEAKGQFAMLGDVSRFVTKTREASRICWNLLSSAAPQVARELT